MNADPQVHERLARAADAVRLDVETRLRDLHARAPRRAIRRKVLSIGVAAILAAIAIGVAWLALPRGTEPVPAVPTEPATPAEPTGVIIWANDRSGLPPPVTALPMGGDSGPRTLEPPGFGGWGWSQDGSRLVWVRDAPGEGPASELVVGDWEGSSPTVVDTLPSVVDLHWVAWAPDAVRLAYVVEGQEGDELWIFDAGTGSASLVGSWPGYVTADWSPDGGRLAVTAAAMSGPPSDEGPGVFVMDPDGGNRVRVSSLEAFDVDWSPAGDTLVVQEAGEPTEGTATGIVLIAVDGSGERRLSPPRSVELYPMWSPDGAWIAFTSDRDATPKQREAIREGRGWEGLGLYLMRADGTDVRRVVQAPDAGLAAAWAWLPTWPPAST